MCVPLYNNVKPILKFISIQEVFISIFNSDSVVKNNQNQKAGKVSQPFLKTVNLGALSIWEPSTRILYFWFLCPNNVGFEFVLLSIDMQLHSKDHCTRYIWSPSWLFHVVQHGFMVIYVITSLYILDMRGFQGLHYMEEPWKGL